MFGITTLGKTLTVPKKTPTAMSSGFFMKMFLEIMLEIPWKFFRTFFRETPKMLFRNFLY